MGIFDYKPHVSKRGFKYSSINLRKKGFSWREIKEVEQVFRGDIDEKGAQIGIDRDEFKKGVNWMRRNITIHKIPQKKIDIIEEELGKRIK